MEKERRIEIEDFVQNMVEWMEEPESGEMENLRELLREEWIPDENGERIYQITNIYEEKEDEILVVELRTGIHLENGIPAGHFTLYLCEDADGWKLHEKRMMEYLQRE